jgi:hypothetical protein
MIPGDEPPCKDWARRSSCPEDVWEGKISPREDPELTSQDGARSRSATRTPRTGQENTPWWRDARSGVSIDGCIRNDWVSSRSVSMNAPTRALFSTCK